MKVLLLDREDSPCSGGWANHRWDLIVDLGWAGASCYRQWEHQLGTRCLSLYDFQESPEIFRRVNELIDVGRNQLVDSQGLDWWEMDAAVNYQRLQSSCLFARLVEHLKGKCTELAVTRTSSETTLLGHALGCTVKSFRPRVAPHRKLSALAGRLRRLTPAQIFEIVLDKWDGSYQYRRWWSRQGRVGASEPLVLLPSPYVNVSRTALAYASLLPHRKFLLAATRNDGKWKHLPQNVLQASLAAYAVPAKRSRAEARSLIEAWLRLCERSLTKVGELRWALQTGFLDHFPSMLSSGLCVRDAWRCLLEQEPIEGVLCGDDLNVYTRIPLALAKQMGLRAIYCAHGALDAGLLFKKGDADVYLCKGEMEKDYMVRLCGVPDGQVVIGAPRAEIRRERDGPRSCRADSIVFFSQPYEVYNGRAEEAYREILPRLCELARWHGRKVIIKLHPFESRRDRSRLMQIVLQESQRSLATISRCRFASELFDQIWFGISVSSSVALECTLHRIPFFNCNWLEPRDCGYAQHFGRFGVGQVLHAPEEIDRIPERISEFAFKDGSLKRLYEQIDGMALDRILSGPLSWNAPAAAVASLSERVALNVARRSR